MENLLFQDDFSACNLSFPPNYFFWPEFEDVLRWWFLTIFFIFVMQLNLRLVLRFDPILSTQMQTILSSLFFQKIRLSELKLAISFKESNRTCLEHSRTFLDVQICPRDRNWDWAIVTWLPCQFFFYLYSGGSRGRARGTRPHLIFRPNRPFYRYGGHIELIRFKEYYRMPRGHEHISFVFLSAFRDTFS